MARNRAAISQTELAKAIGLSASAVAQWEHPSGTKPTCDNLIRVAEITDVSFEWLAIGKARPQRSKGMDGAEVPAVTLEVYARTVQEETLLDVFRNVPARRRPLLIAIAQEFTMPTRPRSSKRR